MSGHVKPVFGTLLKAFPVFVIAVIIAIVLNEAAYFSGLLEEHEFNMFFISRHGESEIPVYSQVHKALPYPVSLLVYIFGFTAAADVILMLAKLAHKWSKRSVRRASAA